jgi:hypothetical protein
MSGNGKYTQYAAPASGKNTLLNKLFHSDDPTLAPVAQDLVGKEDDVRKAVVALAKQAMLPSHQSGDPALFPQGVDLDYTYKQDPSMLPDIPSVKWKNPGDPANPYIPDISSPGPGKVSPLDKSKDPEIKVEDIKPNYVQGAPDTSTASPVAAAEKIVAANELGNSPGKLGDSGANG